MAIRHYKAMQLSSGRRHFIVVFDLILSIQKTSLSIVYISRSLYGINSYIYVH